MDKAEAMRHQAFLPDSWWEFAINHAVYLYNRTPICRLKWLTPFELIEKKRPDISDIKVFGCGAYVFIPEGIRKNKLAPKGEYMTYPGNAEGLKAYLFMRITNCLLAGTTATFDETNFPWSKSQRRVHTRIREDAERLSNNDPTFLDDDDESPTFPTRVPILPRENKRRCSRLSQRSFINTSTSCITATTILINLTGLLYPTPLFLLRTPLPTSLPTATFLML